MYFYSFPQIAQKIVCMTQPSYSRCHIPRSVQLPHTLYTDLAPKQKCRFSVVPHGNRKNWQTLTVPLPTWERASNHCGWLRPGWHTPKKNSESILKYIFPVLNSQSSLNGKFCPHKQQTFTTWVRILHLQSTEGRLQLWGLRWSFHRTRVSQWLEAFLNMYG